jgi:hypothetical protein
LARTPKRCRMLGVLQRRSPLSHQGPHGTSPLSNTPFPHTIRPFLVFLPYLAFSLGISRKNLCLCKTKKMNKILNNKNPNPKPQKPSPVQNNIYIHTYI